MNPEAEAYAELLTLLTLTWPEVTGVYKESSLARTNWVRMVESGGLVTPYVVVEVGASESSEWGLDNTCFRWSVGVVYVSSTGEADVAGFVFGRLAALRSALLLYSGGGFQCAGEEPVVDVRSGLEVNRVILGLQAPLYAGELRAKLLVGSGSGA